MLPYVFIVVLLICLTLFQRKKSTHSDYVFWALLVVFVLFFGIRGDIGHDYGSYAYFYNVISVGDVDSMCLLEPGFTLLVLILKMLHLPFQFLILTSAIIINVLLFIFVRRYSACRYLALLIFLCMDGFINEIDFVRTSIAMGFFLLSIPYLINRNFKQYALINGIGCLFHFSSIFYIMLYPFFSKEVKKSILATLFVAAVIVSQIHIRYFDCLYEIPYINDLLSKESISYYIKDIPMSGIRINISFVIRVLTAAGVILYYDKLKSNHLTLVSTNAFAVLFLTYMLLSAYPLLATRISNMFVFTYMLLWPAIIDCIDTKKLRYSVITVLLSYFVIKMASLLILPQWEYKTFI